MDRKEFADYSANEPPGHNRNYRVITVFVFVYESILHLNQDWIIRIFTVAHRIIKTVYHSTYTHIYYYHSFFHSSWAPNLSITSPHIAHHFTHSHPHHIISYPLTSSHIFTSFYITLSNIFYTFLHLQRRINQHNK